MNTLYHTKTNAIRSLTFNRNPLG